MNWTELPYKKPDEKKPIIRAISTESLEWQTTAHVDSLAHTLNFDFWLAMRQEKIPEIQNAIESINAGILKEHNSKLDLPEWFLPLSEETSEAMISLSTITQHKNFIFTDWIIKLKEFRTAKVVEIDGINHVVFVFSTNLWPNKEVRYEDLKKMTIS